MDGGRRQRTGRPRRTRGRRARIAVVTALTLAATVAAGLATTPPAGASTAISVTSTADGGPGSLRDAFAQANAVTDLSDDIVLLVADGTYELTDCSSELVYTNTVRLRIQATNQATIRQTCPGKRVLTGTTAATLQLKNFVVEGGNVGDDTDGGGISAGAVTLWNSTVRDNSAGIGGKGGGVYASGLVTFWDNVRVTGNTVEDGGQGAGIYAGGGAVTNNSGGGAGLIDHNTINGHGSGAGLAANGAVTLHGVGVVANHIVDGGTGAGVAELSSFADLSLTSGYVQDNTIGSNGAAAGGGLWSANTVTLTDTAVQGNAIAEGAAAATGGGVAATAGGTLLRSTIRDNATGSGGTGGGVRTDGPLTLDGATLSGNHAGSGGGVHTTAAVTLTRSTLLDDDAPSGSEVLATGGGSLASVDSTLLARTGATGPMCDGTSLPVGATSSRATDASCGTAPGVGAIDPGDVDTALGPWDGVGGAPRRTPELGGPLSDAGCGDGSCDIGASAHTTGRTSWYASDATVSVATGGTVPLPAPGSTTSATKAAFLPVDDTGGGSVSGSNAAGWQFTAGTSPGIVELPFVGSFGNSSGIGTITVVIGGDAAPVPAPQTTTVSPTAPTAIALAATDADGDPLTYRLDPGVLPAQGSVTLAGTTATYTPPPGCCTATRQYVRFRVTDPSGHWNAAVVRLDTGDGPPSPPRNLVASAAQRAVTLNWAQSTASGSVAITGYRATLTPQSGGWPVRTETSGASYPYLAVRDLAPDTVYDVSVVATSSAGDSVAATAIFSTASTVYDVTTTADSGPGSLRDAMAQAEADGVLSTVRLPGGAEYDLTSGPLTSSLTTRLVTASGAPAAIRQTVAGQSVVTGTGVVLDHVRVTGTRGASGVAVTTVHAYDSEVDDNQGPQGGGIDATNAYLYRTSVHGNEATTGGGGGIRATSWVELHQSTMDGNTAATYGGGAMGSALRVEDSEVTGNQAGIHGGGLYDSDYYGGTIATGSLLADNRALTGGGGGVASGYFNLTNSTITGNSAANGGGISGSTGYLRSVTLVDNTAGTGGNIAVSGTTELSRSVVSGGSCSAPSGLLKTPAVNWFQVVNLDAAGCPWVLFGGQYSGSDPKLGPLADNGGPTRTRLPQTGSTLIDKVTCGETVDQRGVARPQGVKCDFGAAETTAPITAPDGSISTTIGNPATITVAVTGAGSRPLTYSIVTPPTDGSVSGSGPDFTYLPTDPHAAVDDSFVYQARTDDGMTDTGTVTVHIAPGPPLAPGNLTATPTAGQLAVDWVPPASDGGAAVDDYEVWVAPAGGGDVIVRHVAPPAHATVVAGLAPGGYNVQVRAGNSNGYGPWSQTVGTVPAASMSGSAVDAATSAALAGIRVRAYTPGGVLAGSGTTGADGSWSLSGLAAGSYVLQFADKANGVYQLEYWQDATTPADATPVAAGTTGLTARLDKVPPPPTTGNLTGKVVRNSNGAALAGIRVRAFTLSRDLAGATTTATNGTWTLTGLPVGFYFVQFADTTNHLYRLEYWHDAPTMDTASVVQTGAASFTARLDLTAPNLAVSGIVVDNATSTPLVGIRIRAYTLSGQLAGSTYSGAGGAWSIPDLASGFYAIQFADTANHVYDLEYWQNAGLLLSATPVPAGTTGITARLGPDAPPPPPADLFGTVADADTDQALAGIRVRAYRLDGTFAGQTFSNLDGTWTLTGLADGSYFVQFADTANGLYRLEYWHDANTTATATPVATGASGVAALLDRLA